MNIGTAILIIGVFALIVWQVKSQRLLKRGAWKRVSKIVLVWLLVIGGSIAALIRYVNWSDNQAQEQAALRVADFNEALRNEGINEYLGLRLGMSSNEVLYNFGSPTIIKPIDSNVEFETRNEAFRLSQRWDYKDATGGTKQVWFDGSGKVRVLSCSGNYSRDCPELGSVEIGDEESSIIAGLGTPTFGPKINDQGLMTIGYGPRTAVVMYWLSKGSVIRLTVMGRAQ
ncbi:MAG: outer membrane protein assembly factor BamE [Gammaproteobacteria bacterium]|nr:outer membrane protein assembly factor BamE [Gammaproteobacteria bacterium]